MIHGRPIEGGTDPSSNDRLIGGLCYVVNPLLPLVVLVSSEMKDRAFLRFHAVQAMGVGAAVGVYAMLATVVFVVVSTVTFGFGACCAWPLLVLPIVVVLYYAYLAAQDKYFDVPYVTDLMVRQEWLTRPWVASEGDEDSQLIGR